MKQRDWAKDYTDLLAERDTWKARAEAAEKELFALQTQNAIAKGDIELLRSELTLANARAEAAEKRIADLVVAYDHNNPLRTADVHPLNCTCMRCAIDKVRAA